MFQMKTILKAKAATYLVIALAVLLCAHLTEAKSKSAPAGNSEIICQESVIPGPRADNKQILCEIRKDEYYACEMSNCNSGKGSPSTNPFSKMTWQKCGQPTATGAPGPQDRTVTGTLNYGVEHENGLMGVRGTEPGVSGDHYYQCSLSQNPQRSHCTGCQHVKLGGPP
ncbi:hypothetical protein PSHT_06380 [Puccinia striiformis]|uniref:Ig-like domain-containing protein n=1 Tax=Puccinia striiformis TaxID=27350 RepID=A0A2S4W6Q6_9BASI|nr:hypothetical protein PSHT_06380 [Puccinia striiformis]